VTRSTAARVEAVAEGALLVDLGAPEIVRDGRQHAPQLGLDVAQRLLGTLAAPPRLAELHDVADRGGERAPPQARLDEEVGRAGGARFQGDGLVRTRDEEDHRRRRHPSAHFLQDRQHRLVERAEEDEVVFLRREPQAGLVGAGGLVDGDGEVLLALR